jgi:hypothetical protein
MEGKARILLFGFSEEEARRIDGGLAALGVPPALKLRSGQAGMVLRRILAEDGPAAVEGPKASGEPVPQERLVLFHNISDAGVQALMRFFRETAASHPIFAVVTPTSIDWTLGQLLAHLVEERAALEKGR